MREILGSRSFDNSRRQYYDPGAKGDAVVRRAEICPTAAREAEIGAEWPPNHREEKSQAISNVYAFAILFFE
jgi:hypothetical protein